MLRSGADADAVFPCQKTHLASLAVACAMLRRLSVGQKWIFAVVGRGDEQVRSVGVRMIRDRRPSLVS